MQIRKDIESDLRWERIGGGDKRRKKLYRLLDLLEQCPVRVNSDSAEFGNNAC